MTERDDHIARLFHSAVSLDPEPRARFLESACREHPDLCGELRSLLDASDSATEYFDRLAEDAIAPALAGLSIENSEASDAFQSQLETALGDSYRIERELSGGGMSRVFLASEVKLDRKVVIKVLPREMSEGVSVERFRREIQLSARLQHPHIVSVISTDVAGGFLCYTMPFVDGETLRARIKREGALPVTDAVSIWRDVLDALAYAHSNGVIHRDIKPENILLGHRNALVADFGIARAIEAAAGEAEVTGAGVTLGTPTYMAPEQALAEKDADHRIDIYAAGLVMYEMLSGRSPFAGLSARDVLHAHINRPPPPMNRPDVPQQLSLLVMQCLEKQPGARPTSAEWILQRLDNPNVVHHRLNRRRLRVAKFAALAALLIAAVLGIARYTTRGRASAVTSSPPAPVRAEADLRSVDSRPSLAVLPLEALTSDAESESLADILTAALIDRFSQSGTIKVIQGQSAFFFKGHTTRPRAVAESLNVRNLLTGAVYSEGSAIRVLLRVVNGSDESVRWVQTYKGQREKMLVLEDSIERSVARSLLPRITQTSRRRVATADAQAYELYRRGRYEQNYRERAQTLTNSINYLSQAVAKDSGFAEAYAALAVSYGLLATGNISDFPYRVAIDSARYFAEHAIALNDSMPEAFEARAFVRMLFDFDWRGADADAKRAVRLNPYYTRQIYVRAIMHQWRGDFRKAIAELRLDLATDPMSPSIHGELSRALFFNSQYDAARAEMDTAIQLMSGRQLPRLLLTIGEINLNQGRYAEAIAGFSRMLQASPQAPAPRAFLSLAYARSGNRAKAQLHLDDLLQRWRGGRSNAFYVAIAYAGLKDNTNAFAWLDSAYKDHSLRPLLMDPTFAELRQDKRFDLLMRRIGLKS